MIISTDSRTEREKKNQMCRNTPKADTDLLIIKNKSQQNYQPVHQQPPESFWTSSPTFLTTFLSVFSYLWFVPVKWMKSGVEQRPYWLLQETGMSTQQTPPPQQQQQPSRSIRACPVLSRPLPSCPVLSCPVFSVS